MDGNDFASGAMPIGSSCPNWKASSPGACAIASAAHADLVGGGAASTSGTGDSQPSATAAVATRFTAALPGSS